MTETKRKGARSIKDIPKDILDQLNRDEIETACLAEWAAVDRRMLLENILTQQGRKKYLKPVLAHINSLKKQTVNTISETIGTGLLEQILIHKDSDFLHVISRYVPLHLKCIKKYTLE